MATEAHRPRPDRMCQPGAVWLEWVRAINALVAPAWPGANACHARPNSARALSLPGGADQRDTKGSRPALAGGRASAEPFSQPDEIGPGAQLASP